MKKKSKSILAIVLAILLILVVAVTLTTNILFSRKDTPKLFGHYIYMMETNVMEAGSTSGGSAPGVATATDSASASASIRQHTAVIASAYSESDPIAKNNAVLCILGADDASTDKDAEGIAVRRIYNIEQDETGVLKYYPTTMQADMVGTEPPITVDSILGKCSYASPELYSFIRFATGVPGILTLLVLPAVILAVMLIVAIARANGRRDDEFAFEEDYDEVYSEDSYDDDGYDDEEIGGRSPLFRPSENTQSRSLEQKRSSIAENFERKQVNPNSPYQKARTMQFKAQHDVPIYTNPEDQIPYGSNSDTFEGGTYGGSAASAPVFEGNMGSVRPAANHAVQRPQTEAAPTSTSGSGYRGSHEASSPEEARKLGTSRFGASRQTTGSTSAASEKPAARSGNKYESASVDELLAMIEKEKKNLE